MKLKFNVTGMTCAACSARVEKVTKAVPGVENAEVNLLAGTMLVEAESEAISAAVIQAVQNAGYGASVPGGKKTEKKEDKHPAEDAMKEMKKRLIGSFASLAVLMYFTMGHMVGLPEPHWYHGLENALVAALVAVLSNLCWAGFGSVLKVLFSRYAAFVNRILALLLVWCALRLFL